MPGVIHQLGWHMVVLQDKYSTLISSLLTPLEWVTFPKSLYL